MNYKIFKLILCSSIYWLIAIGCQDTSNTPSNNQAQLFTTLSPKDSGLDFINHLVETTESNYYQYLYTYIGGGVAAGDINNDGLVDLYFTANTTADKLYLNKGNFKFEDISQAAGIQHQEGFNTGVTMADVNADGSFGHLYFAWRLEG